MSWHQLQSGDRIRIENRTPSRFLEAKTYVATVISNRDGQIRIVREDDVYSAETGEQINGHDRIIELTRKAPVLPESPKPRPRAKKGLPPDGRP